MVYCATALIGEIEWKRDIYSLIDCRFELCYGPSSESAGTSKFATFELHEVSLRMSELWAVASKCVLAKTHRTPSPRFSKSVTSQPLHCSCLKVHPSPF